MPLSAYALGPRSQTVKVQQESDGDQSASSTEEEVAAAEGRSPGANDPPDEDSDGDVQPGDLVRSALSPQGVRSTLSPLGVPSTLSSHGMRSPPPPVCLKSCGRRSTLFPALTLPGPCM